MQQRALDIAPVTINYNLIRHIRINWKKNLEHKAVKAKNHLTFILLRSIFKLITTYKRIRSGCELFNPVSPVSACYLLNRYLCTTTKWCCDLGIKLRTLAYRAKLNSFKGFSTLSHEVKVQNLINVKHFGILWCAPVHVVRSVNAGIRAARYLVNHTFIRRLLSFIIIPI